MIEPTLTPEQHRAELERRSLDTIRVHNITSREYTVVIDKAIGGRTWTIPIAQRDIGYGRGNNDVPRFIAEKFVKEMVMIKFNEFVEKWRVEYRKTFKEGDYIHGKELASEPRPNVGAGKKFVDDIIKKIWIGLVKEYGKDAPVIEEDDRNRDVFKRGVVGDIIDSLDGKIVEAKSKLAKDIS